MQSVGCKLFQNKRLTWVDGECKAQSPPPRSLQTVEHWVNFLFLFSPYDTWQIPIKFQRQKMKLNISKNDTWQKKCELHFILKCPPFCKEKRFHAIRHHAKTFSTKKCKFVRNKRPSLTRGLIALDMCKWWIFSNQKPQFTMFDVLTMK